MKTIKTNTIIAELTDEIDLLVSENKSEIHLDFRMGQFSSADLNDIFDIREDDCEPTHIKLTLTHESAEAIATSLLSFAKVNRIYLARINQNNKEKNREK